MKTKILAVMIALLSLSLLFLGCDTGTNSDGGSSAPVWPSPPSGGGGGGTAGGGNPQGAALAAAALGGVAVGSTVLIPAGTTIPVGTPITVPAGVTLQPQGALTIAGDLDLEGDLKVKDGTTVTVTGTLNADGNVTVSNGAGFEVDSAGDVTVTGDFTLENGAHCTVEGDIDVGNGGTLTFEDGVTAGADLAGTITVGPGATLKDLNNGGGSLWGTGSGGGKYVYQAGSTAIVANEPSPGAPWVISTRIGAAGDAEATIQLTRGTLTMEVTATGGQITLDGEATIAKAYGISDASIATIAANSKLTVNATGDFILQGTTMIEGTDSTSVIEIAAGGYIKVHTGNTTNGENFYDNTGGTKVTAGGAGPSGYLEVTSGIFKWDGTINSNTGGWKATP